ncbi:hypothetical protein JAAARDRAFT_59726 [Jaapia argillacea MUCL 33604]|uniref:Protein kinase domain-containing protein n=1 Tax=Jaapia argillacea MUCL 33604 TaxID=933084 RepID=A0A067PLQ3_9AGAM|nr:hypothetical protein JAAARDRAFT_59726 [Jaapia argillacea MUCL 33604]
MTSLSDLRQHMSRNGIDIYVIPNRNGHGTPLSSSEKRIRQLSGFLGTSVTAAVSQSSVEVFVHLEEYQHAIEFFQAQGHSDTWVIRRNPSNDRDFWMSVLSTQMLASGERPRVGLDDNLFTHRQVETWINMSSVVPVSIDLLPSQDCPRSHPSTVYPVGATQPALPTERLQELRNWVNHHHGFATIVSASFSIAYVLCLKAEPMIRSYLYVAVDRYILFADSAFDSGTKLYLENTLGVELKPYNDIFTFVYPGPKDRKILLPLESPHSLVRWLDRQTDPPYYEYPAPPFPAGMEQYQVGFENSIRQWPSASKLLHQPPENRIELQLSTAKYFTKGTVADFSLPASDGDTVTLDNGPACDMIFTWLLNMLKSSEASRFLQQLRGTEAREYLDAFQINILDWLRRTGNRSRLSIPSAEVLSIPRRVIRLLLNIAKDADEIPDSMIIHEGVTWQPGAMDILLYGGFSTIKQGTYQVTYQGRVFNSLVAVKSLNGLLAASPAQRAKARRILCNESLPWRQLAHSSIVRFFGLWESEGVLRMIMEWAGENNQSVVPLRQFNQWPSASQSTKSFNQLVRPLKPRGFYLPTSFQLADIAAGLTYLEHVGLAHGDISGNNILVKSETVEGGRTIYRAKICDFGLASLLVTLTTILSLEPSQPSGLCNKRYAAPELLRNSGTMKPTHATDIYAFAIVCWELYSGRDAFAGMEEAQFIHEVCTENRRPRHEATQRPRRVMTDQLWALLEVCWHRDPARRPNAGSALMALMASASTH